MNNNEIKKASMPSDIVKGAAAGAIIGSVVPGVGTAAGAALGSLYGAAAGMWKKPASAPQEANDNAAKSNTNSMK